MSYSSKGESGHSSDQIEAGDHAAAQLLASFTSTSKNPLQTQPAVDDNANMISKKMNAQNLEESGRSYLREKIFTSKKRKVGGAAKARRQNGETKPKHPMSAYNFFFQRERTIVRGCVAEASKIIGQRWKKLSESQRVPFKNLAEQEAMRYKRELVAFTPSKIGVEEKAQDKSQERNMASASGLGCSNVSMSLKSSQCRNSSLAAPHDISSDMLVAPSSARLSNVVEPVRQTAPGPAANYSLIGNEMLTSLPISFIESYAQNTNATPTFSNNIHMMSTDNADVPNIAYSSLHQQSMPSFAFAASNTEESALLELLVNSLTPGDLAVLNATLQHMCNQGQPAPSQFMRGLHTNQFGTFLGAPLHSSVANNNSSYSPNSPFPLVAQLSQFAPANQGRLETFSQGNHVSGGMNNALALSQIVPSDVYDFATRTMHVPQASAPAISESLKNQTLQMMGYPWAGY